MPDDSLGYILYEENFAKQFFIYEIHLNILHSLYYTGGQSQIIKKMQSCELDRDLKSNCELILLAEHSSI